MSGERKRHKAVIRAGQSVQIGNTSIEIVSIRQSVVAFRLYDDGRDTLGARRFGEYLQCGKDQGVSVKFTESTGRDGIERARIAIEAPHAVPVTIEVAL